MQFKLLDMLFKVASINIKYFQLPLSITLLSQNWFKKNNKKLYKTLAIINENFNAKIALMQFPDVSDVRRS